LQALSTGCGEDWPRGQPVLLSRHDRSFTTNDRLLSFEDGMVSTGIGPPLRPRGPDRDRDRDPVEHPLLARAKEFLVLDRLDVSTGTSGESVPAEETLRRREGA
jgi:hypothetical protein